MKKKLLAVLLALGLVITCMPMVVLAASPGISVDKTEVKKGETVKLTATLPDEVINKTLEGLEYQVKFNKNALKVTNIVSKDFTGAEYGNTTVGDANTKAEFKWSVMEKNASSGFQVTDSSTLYAEFEALEDSGSAIIELIYVEIYDADNTIDITLSTESYEFTKSVTLQLTGADGGKTLTKDAHIKGNVLDVAEEYNVVIIYNDDAVYTYIPNDAKDSDINKTYQNAENGVTLSPTDKETVRGKWCGYGDGVDNVGFDGNKNRITIINGMDVAGTVTATAAKDAGIKGETFSINLTTSDEVDGSANYAILRDACITGSTEEQLNAAFNQCGSSDKFGKRTISTGGFSLGAINTQGNTIKYANIYYSLTGNPGTGMANWGGTVNTTLGTITITVQAA